MSAEVTSVEQTTEQQQVQCGAEDSLNADVVQDESSPLLLDNVEETPMDLSSVIDRLKVKREQAMTMIELYKPLMLVGGWALLASISSLTAPYMTDLESDQLGGDQKAGEINSIIACVTAVAELFTASFYGKLVDSYGRRPFFIIGSFTLIVITGLQVFLQQQIVVSMIVGGILSLIQTSFIYAWVADVYSSKMRTQGIGFLVALSSVSALLTIITAFLPQNLCMYIAFGSTILTFAYSFFIPESIHDVNALREEAVEIVRQHRHRIGDTSDVVHSFEALGQGVSIREMIENPFASMKPLVKSKYMVASITILCFYVIAHVGTGDVYMFYLQERVNFTPRDNTYLIVETGLTQPLVMMGLLPLLMRSLSPVMILIFSLVMLILELIIIATLWAKWPVYALAVPVVALSEMLPTVITGMIQNSGDGDQGTRMTGLMAFGDFASAVGPLMFGLIYGNVKAALVFLPFLVCALLAVVPMVLTIRLNKWRREETAARVRSESRAPTA